MKFTYDSVKSYIEQQGYSLQDTTYVSSQEKLNILCPNGHTINPIFSEFKRKARCNECSKNKQPTIESIQDFVSSKGFKVLSDKYINNNTKLDIQCQKGHIWGITWINIKNGNGCPHCFGNAKYSTDAIANYVKDKGYILSDTGYQNTSIKTELTCPNNHKYSVRIHDFISKESRCVSCSHQTSKTEQEILDWVTQYTPTAKKAKFYDIIQDCPKEYKNKELDIYIPELRLAIEYCGLYWHSEASGEKSPQQHRNKLTWCRANGIRLITIFEDEWLTRKEQVKNLLMSVLGVHTVKLGARKCEIRQIDNSTAKCFVDTHHIQTLYSCSIAFGLFCGEELVGVITGNKHHRQNQNSFVLQRMCFKQGYQISGGASKLLSSLIAYTKSLGYNELVSWSDNRISEGSVYQKTGFRLKTEYNQDYAYVKEGFYEKRYGKQGLKKTPEERLTGKTEHELRKEQGYYRIWDCGKKLWVLSL